MPDQSPYAAPHSAPDSTTAAKSSVSEKPAASRRYLPGPVASVLIMLSLVGIGLVRIAQVPQDHAEANLLMFSLGLLCAATLFVWFVFFSAFPKKLRRGVIYSSLVLLLAAVATVRIYQVSGEMIPSFRFVWSPLPDQQLDIPEGTDEPVDLSTQTAYDFPQFLGPTRDGRVSIAIEPPELNGGRVPFLLERDWKNHPPRKLWKQAIGAGWSGFAAVNGYAVTMEQRGDQELVTCYEVKTGKPRWSHGIAARHETLNGGIGPRATPTINNGRVYAMGATGILRCLDGEDGSLLWSKDLPAEFGLSPGEEGRYVSWGRANSPLVIDNLVVVPAGGPPGKTVSLVAYDKVSGAQIWTAGDRQISYCSPVVMTLQGIRQIVSVNEDTVSGHDPQTGAVLWTCPWDGSSSAAANTSQPQILHDTIIVTKGYRGGGTKRFEVNLDEKNCNELYHRENLLRTKLTSAITDQTFAYGLSDGILECVDLSDGKRQWKSGRYGHGQILLVRDVLLVLTEGGDLVMLEATPEKHAELGRVPVLEGKTWNTLCLHGQHLLVRNAEEAACFELAYDIPDTPFNRAHEAQDAEGR
jgi:outer membrane protein assembly factor BamB